MLPRFTLWFLTMAVLLALCIAWTAVPNDAQCDTDSDCAKLCTSRDCDGGPAD